ncbi:MAG TPA: hypothetical protein ENH49_01295 [Candidatus Marinimicrobia bacterium]|nr:hypothetical protein [Candidatus Neomarinimicrobiota bacterium]
MSMIFKSRTIFNAIFLFSVLWASTPDSTEKIPETGYILPTCDSLGVPLFVDGINVGKSPIRRPVPVLAGFHEVGYAPPQIRDAYVKKQLYQAIKKVYVPIGDTVRVALYFDQEYTQYKAIKTENKITHYVGMVMIISSIYLFWRVSG